MYGINDNSNNGGGVVQNGRRRGTLKGSPQSSESGGGEIEVFDVKKCLVGELKKIIIKRHGSNALAGFARRFLLMDKISGGGPNSKKGDGKLESYELHRGLSQVGIECDRPGAESLLRALDRDGSGHVCFNEFIYALRGDMSKPRIDITDQAFKIICSASSEQDKLHPNCANTHDYAAAYDVSQNEDVLQGRKTTAQALSEFMANFDQDGNGFVTRDEFLDYYRLISASIDRDDYYELMMRNAWHIAGGTGAAQGTTNRKVGYRVQGEIKYVELSNDLGVDLSNPKSVKRVLYSMGIHDYDKLYLNEAIEV